VNSAGRALEREANRDVKELVALSKGKQSWRSSEGGSEGQRTKRGTETGKKGTLKELGKIAGAGRAGAKRLWKIAGGFQAVAGALLATGCSACD
jgi:hypothetical protein